MRPVGYTSGGTANMQTPLDRGAFAQRLHQGDVTWGTFLGLASPLAAEVTAAAGVDWVLLDLEHGAAGDDQIHPTIVATGAYGVPTLVRVESSERIRIGRALDAGAAGVMIPRLESADQVREVVRNFHYPPLGNRGVASYNRAARWGMDPTAMPVKSEAAVIIQIETVGALDQVRDIAAVDGVDLLFVGPLDLSFALGIPRDYTSPVFEAALAAVLAASRECGVAAGILAPNAAAAARYRQMGFTFIGIASDSVLLANIITTTLTELQKEQS